MNVSFLSMETLLMKILLIQNYGQPNYYSPTSAWGEVYMYKIGNKNVRFYIDNAM